VCTSLQKKCDIKQVLIHVPIVASMHTLVYSRKLIFLSAEDSTDANLIGLLCQHFQTLVPGLLCFL
jgi:hypothetical protein